MNSLFKFIITVFSFSVAYFVFWAMTSDVNYRLIGSSFLMTTILTVILGNLYLWTNFIDKELFVFFIFLFPIIIFLLGYVVIGPEAFFESTQIVK